MRKTAIFWTDDLLEKFIKTAMLDSIDSRIIQLRIYSYTIKEIAESVGLSTSTVSRRIKLLKEKYDELEAGGYGFPPRHRLQKMDKP